MILIYGKARRNIYEASVLYAERYPKRNIPSRFSFYRVMTKFLGNVYEEKRKQQKIVTGENNEIVILVDDHNSQISFRSISYIHSIYIGISRRNVLYEYLNVINFTCITYHYINNYIMIFKIIVRSVNTTQIEKNNNFFLFVLFSDELTYTNCGEVNGHNMYCWTMEKIVTRSQTSVVIEY